MSGLKGYGPAHRRDAQSDATQAEQKAHGYVVSTLYCQLVMYSKNAESRCKPVVAARDGFLERRTRVTQRTPRASRDAETWRGHAASQTGDNARRRITAKRSSKRSSTARGAARDARFEVASVRISFTQRRTRKTTLLPTPARGHDPSVAVVVCVVHCCQQVAFRTTRRKSLDLGPDTRRPDRFACGADLAAYHRAPTASENARQSI